MRLKLYRAATIAQAMARVRAELGEDALILATRRAGDGIEVTVALEQDDPPAAKIAEPARSAAFTYHALPPALCERLRTGDLPTALAATLPFEALPLVSGAQPLLFVGPPGAGKTLTVARLATRLVMHGKAPLVITADGKRAGATEQLAAFTRLLRLGLIVACHPVTLGRALTHRSNGVPVLIDSPGCDPFDHVHREEMVALADIVGAIIVLVLPAGLDPAEAAELAAAFASAGARLLIATRFDLTRRLGGVLAAAVAGRLALAEAGIGPGAADGLVPLTPDWLANRLLAVPRGEALL